MRQVIKRLRRLSHTPRVALAATVGAVLLGAAALGLGVSLRPTPSGPSLLWLVLVGAAIEQLGSRVVARPVKIDIPAETPFVSVDFGLITQSLYNILDNALKYSPAG